MNTTKAMQQIRRDGSLACAEVDYLLDFISSSQRGVILRLGRMLPQAKGSGPRHASPST